MTITLLNFYKNMENMEKYMGIALKLAEKARGITSPNPMVGCFIVKNNKIVGTGYHQKAGKKHAEIIALTKAGKNARGATMYVTLEPCSHFGKTPPCVDSIIKSGIKEVIIAMKDPNPLVQGIKILQKNNIKTKIGNLKQEAEELNKFWIKFISKKIPYVILKIAISLDQKIAGQNGKPIQISNIDSQTYVHKLRGEVDAVLVGVNTVISDDPQLTTRFVKGKNPMKIVLDTKLRIPLNSKVFNEPGKLIVAVGKKAPKNTIGKVEKKGAKVLISKSKEGRILLRNLLPQLGKMNITSVLVESGQSIFDSFLNEKAADEVLIFVAPKLIKNGIDAFKNQNAVKLKDVSVVKLDDDIMIKGALK